MREIKFRIWNPDAIMLSERMDYNPCLSLKSTTATVAPDINDLLDSNKYNLMQYTGLKDKNCTDIYEGDITTNELYKNEGLAFVVYYDNEKGMFKQRPFMFENNGKELVSTDLTLQMDSVTNKEVIGNVYENSDLLQVDNQ